MKIITIIPAYNEEKTIKMVVKHSLKYSDVLVIDDGSTDQTTALVKEAGGMVIKHDTNQGKGSAIKTGLKKALDNNYQVMVLMDGDGQHDPHYIPVLVSGVKKGSMIVGSRFKNGSTPGMALQRKLSNKLTTKILNNVTGYRIHDSQCGFRAIPADIARIFLNIPYNDYIYESEVLYQASLKKVTVKEMPIPCAYKGEKSYITWVNVLKYIIFILKLLLRDLKRRIKH